MTNFSRADLSGANLKGSYQGQTQFRGANLSGAVWTDGKVCAAGSIGSCS